MKIKIIECRLSKCAAAAISLKYFHFGQVENYLMLSEFENNLIQQSALPVSERKNRKTSIFRHLSNAVTNGRYGKKNGGRSANAQPFTHTDDCPMSMAAHHMAQIDENVVEGNVWRPWQTAKDTSGVIRDIISDSSSRNLEMKCWLSQSAHSSLPGE